MLSSLEKKYQNNVVGWSPQRKASPPQPRGKGGGYSNFPLSSKQVSAQPLPSPAPFNCAGFRKHSRFQYWHKSWFSFLSRLQMIRPKLPLSSEHPSQSDLTPLCSPSLVMYSVLLFATSNLDLEALLSLQLTVASRWPLASKESADIKRDAGRGSRDFNLEANQSEGRWMLKVTFSFLQFYEEKWFCLPSWPCFLFLLLLLPNSIDLL